MSLPGTDIWRAAMKGTFNGVEDIYKDLFVRYPILETAKEDIYRAYELLAKTFDNAGTLYVAGNGGSAADSEHIVGELCKSFTAKRPIEKKLADVLIKEYECQGEELCKYIEGGLPAVSLPSLVALNSAISNDIGSDFVYAQSLNALASSRDAFLGISTSGNSKNILNAMMVSKAKRLVTIGLCGEQKCKIDDICDVTIHAPASETYKVQELHLPIYHALCAMIESNFWRE